MLPDLSLHPWPRRTLHRVVSITTSRRTVSWEGSCLFPRPECVVMCCASHKHHGLEADSDCSHLWLQRSCFQQDAVLCQARPHALGAQVGYVGCGMDLRTRAARRKWLVEGGMSGLLSALLRGRSQGCLKASPLRVTFQGFSVGKSRGQPCGNASHVM